MNPSLHTASIPALPASKPLDRGAPAAVGPRPAPFSSKEASVTRRKLSLLLLLAAFIAAPLSAGTHSTAAFKKLQSLAGDWEGKDGHGMAVKPASTPSSPAPPSWNHSPPLAWKRRTRPTPPL